MENNINQEPEFWRILKTLPKSPIPTHDTQFLSKRFLLKRYLGFTDEEIDEQIKTWKDNEN